MSWRPAPGRHLRVLWLTVAKIQDMRVSAEPHVVCEIPSFVIRIVINHDLIAVPQPIAGVIVVIRCNAEVKTAEPEAIPATAAEPEDVPAPNPARKTAMLPW